MKNDVFVLASGNEGKIREMREILMNMNFRLISREDAGVFDSPEETGKDFEENAILKASSAVRICKMPVIADDSGLCVYALDGAPGVLSARFGGDVPYTEKHRMLLKMLEDKEDRSAKFVSVVACAFPNGDIITARGECQGEIADYPRGDGGFGYDPVFIVRNTGKTMAQLSASQKNSMSHRGRALRDFEEKLRRYYADR